MIRTLARIDLSLIGNLINTQTFKGQGSWAKRTSHLHHHGFGLADIQLRLYLIADGKETTLSNEYAMNRSS